MAGKIEIKAPRGTQDYLPERAAVIHWLDCLAEDIFSRAAYRRIITPAFEETALFTRGIGEGSDIVRKEMYTFSDRSGRQLTLRPEMTASVVRAFIEHNLDAGVLPAKLFYFGNMFRYERPQAGRYREFWQLGVEALGSAGSVVDAEVIVLAMDYLAAVGIENMVLKIGSMGDESCRPAYTETLRQDLSEKAALLCEDCRDRLRFNPLRVFDCKKPECQRVLAAAPKMIDHLCRDCRAHLGEVRGFLDRAGLDYTVDPMLVRGFDYYTRTTFEIESAALGAQNALGGGGRYDRLVADYGGRPTPAVGFALGVERLVMAAGPRLKSAQERGKKIDVFIAVIEGKDRGLAFELAWSWRRRGLTAEIDSLGRSLRSQMKVADKIGAAFAVVLGPDELAREEAVVRDLTGGAQAIVKLKELVNWLVDKKDAEA